MRYDPHYAHRRELCPRRRCNFTRCRELSSRACQPDASANSRSRHGNAFSDGRSRVAVAIAFTGARHNADGDHSAGWKVDGHVIGIDPARGYSSKIQGVSTKIYANRLNYAVATLVKEKLEQEGATVVFSLNDVKDDKTSSERAAIFNSGGVELVLRIECNFVNATDTRGAMAWIPEKHDQKSACSKLANAVLNSYINATGLSLREVKGESIIEKSDETFFIKTEAPVCTLFIGHISNAEEDKKINNSDFQKTMAEGIVNGILSYLGIK